ncbi:MAG: hypothetical protein ACR2M3_17490 [Thermomicrobiales bacterium]
MQRPFRGWPALLVFGVLLALVTIAPQAVGASGLQVQFSNANGQKTLVLVGNGFAPGEKVTISGFTADNQTASFPDTTADAIGGFSTQIPYQSSVYRVKVSGQLTGITVLADVGAVAGTPPGFLPAYPRLGPCYYFDTGYYYNSCPSAGFFGPGYAYNPGVVINPAPAPVPVPAPAPVPVPAPASGTGTATAGQPVTFSVGGFTPNETVSASVTAPDASVAQIGSAQAAADGTVTISLTFPAAGNWQITAHGQSSSKDVVTRYTVS